MNPPAALLPVAVPKPWGREIWFSGIERRGESRVRCNGEAVRLSAYLGRCGRRSPVTLLKILEPTAGNLYLELHETKWEVYVVDAVDRERWPAGGRMLLGADAAVRRRLGDAAFRDALLAESRRAEASGEVAAVEAFMRRVPLAPGDAVAIPPRVPHSLLHGVRVVEFQTPVFERRIVAASQPVATQRGWDSERAVAVMDLDAAPPVLPASAAPAQTIARAPGFALVRRRLEARQTLAAPAWSIGYVVAGTLRWGTRRFAAPAAFVCADAAELRAVDAAEVLLAEEGKV